MSIDYGSGQTNIDHATGIRYGVIHHGLVGQAWYDTSEAYYGPICCPKCGAENSEDAESCAACGAEWEVGIFDFVEPISFYVDDGKYLAEQTADDPDIFIMKSPYFTYTDFCSPCAPGAGYLSDKPHDPDTADCRAFCFGPDMFWDALVPYDVYSVETSELVCKAGTKGDD